MTETDGRAAARPSSLVGKLGRESAQLAGQVSSLDGMGLSEGVFAGRDDDSREA